MHSKVTSRARRRGVCALVLIRDVGQVAFFLVLTGNVTNFYDVYVRLIVVCLIIYSTYYLFIYYVHDSVLGQKNRKMQIQFLYPDVEDWMFQS